jgi:hypothetical protein
MPRKKEDAVERMAKAGWQVWARECGVAYSWEDATDANREQFRAYARAMREIADD